MSYINYTLLYQYDLSESDYHILRKSAQGDLHLIVEGTAAKLIDLGLLSEKLATTKKGKKLISLLESPDVTAEIDEFVQRLVGKYESKGLGDRIGSTLKASKDLAWFMKTTGISFRGLDVLVEKYLSERGQYSKYLENIFWKGENVYSKAKKLEESDLYSYFANTYNINKEVIEKRKTTKLVKWLSDINALNPPKRLDKELTFTGDVKTDIERIQLIQNQFKKMLVQYSGTVDKKNSNN